VSGVLIIAEHVAIQSFGKLREGQSAGETEFTLLKAKYIRSSVGVPTRVIPSLTAVHKNPTIEPELGRKVFQCQPVSFVSSEV